MLDLYAGQGRFGQMALEEGAESVTFIEKEAATSAELNKRLARWKNSCQILVGDALTSRPNLGCFDIVFADPPFGDWEAAFLEKLLRAVIPRMHPDSIFLVKNPSRVLLSGPFPGLTLLKQSKFGESTLTYFRYRTADE